MNGTEKITDLLEDAQQAGRKWVEGARISLKLNGNYLFNMRQAS